MRAQQLVHEAGLFEDAERSLAAGAQQAGDALRFVCPVPRPEARASCDSRDFLLIFSSLGRPNANAF